MGSNGGQDSVIEINPPCSMYQFSYFRRKELAARAFTSYDVWNKSYSRWSAIAPMSTQYNTDEKWKHQLYDVNLIPDFQTRTHGVYVLNQTTASYLTTPTDFQSGTSSKPIEFDSVAISIPTKTFTRSRTSEATQTESIRIVQISLISASQDFTMLMTEVKTLPQLFKSSDTAPSKDELDKIFGLEVVAGTYTTSYVAWYWNEREDRYVGSCVTQPEFGAGSIFEALAGQADSDNPSPPGQYLSYGDWVLAFGACGNALNISGAQVDSETLPEFYFTDEASYYIPFPDTQLEYDNPSTAIGIVLASTYATGLYQNSFFQRLDLLQKSVLNYQSAYFQNNQLLVGLVNALAPGLFTYLNTAANKALFRPDWQQQGTGYYNVLSLSSYPTSPNSTNPGGDVSKASNSSSQLYGEASWIGIVSASADYTTVCLFGITLINNTGGELGTSTGPSEEGQ
eukprot:g3368.t1